MCQQLFVGHHIVWGIDGLVTLVGREAIPLGPPSEHRGNRMLERWIRQRARMCLCWIDLADVARRAGYEVDDEADEPGDVVWRTPRSAVRAITWRRAEARRRARRLR